MKNELKKQKNNNIDNELNTSLETSFFRFYKSSVTWHFVQNTKFQNVKTENNPFSSFETDLLNYQNQKEPPFCTFFKVYNQNAKVIFPLVYDYISEGQSHTMKTDPERLELSIRLSVSHSSIVKSEKTIAHVTIAPAFDEYFSELDLIKLATLFGSKQEETNVFNQIRFKINDENKVLTPVELLKTIYGLEEKIESDDSSTTGIIQIEENDPKKELYFSFDSFLKLFQNSNRTSIKDDSLRQFSKTLCGIILGIFDFNRMDDEEIFDTIQPIVRKDTSFMVLCRGTLFKISKKDEIMESITDDIIVSPYLLIPNMVLTHNEFILLNLHKDINEILDQKTKSKLRKSEDCQMDARKILNEQYLHNLFQYPSEKDIVDNGNSQRGTSNLYDTIVKRLEELSELIEIKKTNKSTRSDAILNALLGFIAIVQLKGLFKETFDLTNSDKIFFSFTFLVVVVIFVLVWMKKK